MSVVTVDHTSASIEIEPEAAPTPPDQSRAHMAEIAELRALLRPVVIELLEDELSRYTRMRG